MARALPTLHSFSQTYYNHYNGTYSNSDGAFPVAGLILSGNTLYGTTGEWRHYKLLWHGVRRQHQWQGFCDPV